MRWVQSSFDVLLYRFEDRQVTPFLTTQASESHPEISPDGRWLAYRPTRAADRGLRHVASRPGADAHRVSPGGERSGLVRRRTSVSSTRSRMPTAAHSMMAVTVSHGSPLSLGTTHTPLPAP